MAVLALVLPGTGLADDSRRSQPQLVWSEEFNAGTGPDPAIWSHDTGATGWGNQELQHYLRDNTNAATDDAIPRRSSPGIWVPVD